MSEHNGKSSSSVAFLVLVSMAVGAAGAYVYATFGDSDPRDLLDERMAALESVNETLKDQLTRLADRFSESEEGAAKIYERAVAELREDKDALQEKYSELVSESEFLSNEVEALKRTKDDLLIRLEAFRNASAEPGAASAESEKLRDRVAALEAENAELRRQLESLRAGQDAPSSVPEVPEEKTPGAPAAAEAIADVVPEPTRRAPEYAGWKDAKVGPGEYTLHIGDRWVSADRMAGLEIKGIYRAGELEGAGSMNRVAIEGLGTDGYVQVGSQLAEKVNGAAYSVIVMSIDVKSRKRSVTVYAER